MSQQSSPSSAAAPPRRKSFAQQSFGDMVRSMLVLMLIVGAVVLVRSLLTEEEQPRQVRPVDYAGQLQAARSMADYRVLAPRSLGPGWVPTSVDLQSSGGTVRWHLGFLTPAREYVGLEQADFEPQQVAQKYVGDLRRSGSVPVAGEPWQLYRGQTDTALVRRDGEVITVVVGTAGADALTTFARSLR